MSNSMHQIFCCTDKVQSSSMQFFVAGICMSNIHQMSFAAPTRCRALAHSFIVLHGDKSQMQHK